MVSVRSNIFPFILSGGSGTRLWPLSRQAYPKQFLKLIGENSLLKQSCIRVNNSMFSAPSILCNHEHRFLVAEQLQELGIASPEIILEPVGRNTGPAALIAALTVAGKGGNDLVLLMPSDHVISDNKSFWSSITRGADAAKAGKTVIFGVKANTPETRYGYIETAEEEGEILDVVRFVEKPSSEKAEEFLRSNHFLWNAGIFLFSPDRMIKAFETYAPDTLRHCKAALERAIIDFDFLRLDKAAYEQCENISLDNAIMEKISNIKCVPLQTQWSDLGVWSAIWEQMNKDVHGNVTRGDVVLHDVNNSYTQSEDGVCLTLVGLDNIMAIATKDAILIASRDRAEDVKHVVEKLKVQGREEVINQTRVYRPWGWHECLSRGKRFKVKCLMVKAGTQLSLQRHTHRAEHWVVVSGAAEVTLDDRTFLLSENEATYIPVGTKHRLGNPGKVPTVMIEVQSGSYLREDDIVRFEDDFGRE